MPLFKKSHPPIPLEEDCDPPTIENTPGTQLTLPEPDYGWEQWEKQRHALLKMLERGALWFERPFNAIIQNPKLNPFYHTGPITVFLLIIILLTGIYLFAMYQYGFDTTYSALVRIDGFVVGRFARGVHRYASGMALVTSLMHAFRTFFLGQFRRSRWLAWVTGMLMFGMFWLAGVIGYVLVWDEQAQLLVQGALNAFAAYTPFAAPLWDSLLRAIDEGAGSWFFGIFFLLHLGLFLAIAGFFIYHIRRLQRPRWLPDPVMLALLFPALLLAGAFVPPFLQAEANFATRPLTALIDPFFLFFLPNSFGRAPLWILGSLIVLGFVGTAIPWLSLRHGVIKNAVQPPRVHIEKDVCAGCIKCSRDCPYNVIQMHPRTDGKRHKLIGIETPDLCVSCGICVGSCHLNAVSLGNFTNPTLQASIRYHIEQGKQRASGVRLVLTCERHAVQGALPFRKNQDFDARGNAIEVVPVPCVGDIFPDLLTDAIDMGASEVQVVGCPPADCRNNDGNLIESQRLTRERLPKLRKPYEKAPITTEWLAPDQFKQAMQVSALELDAPPSASNRDLRDAITLRNLLPALIIILVTFVAQALLTEIPYRAFPDAQAQIQIVLPTPDNAFPIPKPGGAVTEIDYPTRLVLEANGEIVFASEQFLGAPALYEKVSLSPGDYHLRLMYDNGDGQPPLIIADRQVTLEANSLVSLGLNSSAENNGFCTALYCGD